MPRVLILVIFIIIIIVVIITERRPGDSRKDADIAVLFIVLQKISTARFPVLL